MPDAPAPRARRIRRRWHRDDDSAVPHAGPRRATSSTATTTSIGSNISSKRNTAIRSLATTTAHAYRRPPRGGRRMLKRLPVFGQTTLLAIGFAIVLLVSITEFYISDRFNDATASVSHTIEVQKKISNLLLTIRRAEIGTARVYPDGSADLSAGLSGSVADIRPNFDELRMLVRIVRGKKPISTKQSPSAKQTQRTWRDDPTGNGRAARQASDIVKAGAGQRRMESLRGIFERMLDGRSQSARRTVARRQ